MGFPGAEAMWSSVAGAAIFPGAAGGAGFWSLLGIVACIVILAMGHMSEKKRLDNA